jgi:2-polyprenyl-6-hydroxyphenyl methylase/3-demethylubiquinone-9 3-methyltransferase
LDDASFDLVWSGETIEHVADTAGWLSEVRRVLRSGGTLLLSTPAHGRLSMLALAVSGRAFESHFDPRSDHLRFYTARTLARLLADFGFHDVQVRALGGVPGARRTLLAAARRSRF